MFKNPESKNIFLVSLLILAIAFVAIAYYFSQVAPQAPRSIDETPELLENEAPTDIPEDVMVSEPVLSDVSPTVTPSPRPIPHGKRTFVVSVASNVKGPRIGKGTIDPYDPALNGEQTLTIEVNDTVPVQEVVAVLKTDNETMEYAMQPGTPGQMKGNWTGTWTVNDTYLYTYSLSVRATSANGTTTADITTR
jgi:hypothetical protein